MKRKYYPLVTVVGASLLTIVPIAILSVLMSSNSQTTDIQSDPLVDLSQRPKPPDEPAARKEPAPTGGEASRTPKFVVPPDTLPVPLIAKQPAVARRDSVQRSTSLADIQIAVPDISRQVDDVPTPVDLTSELIESHPVADAIQHDMESDLPVVADTKMPEMPKRTETGINHYDATGHLAMRTQPQVPDPLDSLPGTSDELKNRPKGADSERVDAGKGRNSRSRKSKSYEKAPPVKEANPNLDFPVALNKPHNVPSPAESALLEDVTIQTPLESAPVGRIENVVALTNARGWPIALIRSDLPDDVWWVQQMVGIQGQSLAARVNFGNEYSISGTEYHMVIVFLDSPDEVRRFRIAKQFKVIPEGVRRSREFHYIRN